MSPTRRCPKSIRGTVNTRSRGWFLLPSALFGSLAPVLMSPLRAVGSYPGTLGRHL